MKGIFAILTLLAVSSFFACSADAVSGQYNGSGIVNNGGYLSSSSSDDAEE